MTCSPRVNFQCWLPYGVRTCLCAITCINICEHVKDPGVYVRVGWIMETLKHPACTVDWVVPLCCGWPSPGKQERTCISHGRNPNWTIQLFKKKKRLLSLCCLSLRTLKLAPGRHCAPHTCTVYISLSLSQAIQHIQS